MFSITRTPMLALLFHLLLSGPVVAAEDAAARGLAVAREADARDNGFGNSTADLTMVLYNRAGEEIRRTMRQRTLEIADDGDHSVLVFDRPRDLKGTAILTHTHRVGNDDQWLYLPALDRVKRISASDKSGPFMGSEFAYEDLASQEVEKYRYRYLGEDTLTEKCHMVERVPVNPRSGYSRQVAWYDQEHYRLLRVDYYDRKNELLKTMELSGYHVYLDQYWRPDEMFMTNHQTGKQTLLEFSNYRFRAGLTSRDFERQALARSR